MRPLLRRFRIHHMSPRWTARPVQHTLAATLLTVSIFCGPARLAAGSMPSGKPQTKSVQVHHHLNNLWNPMFPVSHALLVRENLELDRLELPRIADEYELTRYELLGDLVPVSESEALKIAPTLAENRRYCRSWTRDFLRDLSEAYYAIFQSSLQVNSLVRTTQQQHELRFHNRFAAPESGDTASTHLAGVAVDLSLRNVSRAQYDWLHSYLLPLEQSGMVDPIEERQPVLHIVVFKSYSQRFENVDADSEAKEPTEGAPAAGMP